MKIINLKIPDNIGLNQFDIEMYLAAKWFEEGRLSSGQAADFVGLSKRAFIEVLGKYGVSLFGYDFEDLESDLKNV